MDLNGLFGFLIDLNLDEDASCPPLFKKWCRDFTEGNRNLLPRTVEEVCNKLGNMSIGTLVTVDFNRGKAVWPCRSGSGAIYISFENKKVGFEDYAKAVFGPNIRAQQQRAIQAYVANHDPSFALQELSLNT